jgi:hypothetical protein
MLSITNGNMSADITGDAVDVRNRKRVAVIATWGATGTPIDVIGLQASIRTPLIA